MGSGPVLLPRLDRYLDQELPLDPSDNDVPFGYRPVPFVHVGQGRPVGLDLHSIALLCDDCDRRCRPDGALLLLQVRFVVQPDDLLYREPVCVRPDHRNEVIASVRWCPACAQCGRGKNGNDRESLHHFLSPTTRSAVLCPRATEGRGGVQRQLDRLVRFRLLLSDSLCFLNACLRFRCIASAALSMDGAKPFPSGPESTMHHRSMSK